MANFMEKEASRKFYGKRKSGPPEKGCINFPPPAFGGKDVIVRKKRKVSVHYRNSFREVFV